jgi:hypothetical protein
MAEHFPDSFLCLSDSESEQVMRYAGDTPPDEQGQPVREPPDNGHHSAQDDVFRDVLGAVFHGNRPRRTKFKNGLCVMTMALAGQTSWQQQHPMHLAGSRRGLCPFANVMARTGHDLMQRPQETHRSVK